MFDQFIADCKASKVSEVRKFLRELNFSQRQQAIAYNDCASLFWSIANGHEEVLRLLFKAISKKLLREFFSNTHNEWALADACSGNHFETVRIFINQCPKDLINNFLLNLDLELRKKVLKWAIENKEYFVAKSLIDLWPNESLGEIFGDSSEDLYKSLLDYVSILEIDTNTIPKYNNLLVPEKHI